MTFTTLRGGPTLPDDAILLALELEARGFQMREDGGKLKLSGGKASPLTDEDRTKIQRWKTHLLAAISYVPPDRAQ